MPDNCAENSASCESLEDFERDRDFLTGKSERSDSLDGPLPALVDYILRRRVHLILLPLAHGGIKLTLAGEFDLIRSAARISGTFGWIVFQACGNVGRVFSFLDDTTIAQILEETNRQVLICYHNDPVHGTISRRGTRRLLSGRWPFGSLASVATHFAAPFVDSREEMCVVVSKEAVALAEDWNQSALRGTATVTYSLDLFDITDGHRIAVVRCNNDQFLPWYRMARAPIKHAGYAIGPAEEIMASSRSEGGGTGLRAAWEVASSQVIEARERMVGAVSAYEHAMLVGAAQSVLEAHEVGLVRANRRLHSWLLELASLAMQSCPTSGGLSRTRKERNLLVAASMASHFAVREHAHHLGRYLAMSPRFREFIATCDPHGTVSSASGTDPDGNVATEKRLCAE